LNLVVFRREILKSLEKVAGKGGVEKGFLVPNHLIDTDLYIDLIQSGATLPIIRELDVKDTPGIYFSSVVIQELLSGARLPAAKQRVETLFRPFERVGRIVTPSGPCDWNRIRNLALGKCSCYRKQSVRLHAFVLKPFACLSVQQRTRDG
jgi:hypothetical protein